MEILFRLDDFRCGEIFSSCWRVKSDRDKSWSSDDERFSNDDDDEEEESDWSFSWIRRGVGLLAQYDNKSPLVKIRRLDEVFRS